MKRSTLLLSLLSTIVLICSGRAAFALDGVTTVRVASGLNRPVFVTAPKGDYERLFIVEQRGVIKILNLLTGEVLSTAFLNIDSKVTGPDSDGDERGLLGLAFHPDYLSNGAFFVHYSGSGGDTVVSRFFVDPDDPNVADGDSEEVLFTVDQPFSNHNGGNLDFSPIDGYLYLGLGDGGSANDPGDRAQDGAEFLGKILRFDVNDLDSGTYAIPDDNPFVGVAGVLDEIWALGMRNPYRWSFDRANGDLYIADVGQGAEEEVDVQPADSPGGLNYGWCCREGFSATGTGYCTCPDLDTLTDPIVSYSHSGGRCSITGGYVYRGSAIPSLDGVYFYADYCSADIYILSYDGATVSGEENVTDDLAPGGGLSISAIVGFGEDGYGEHYIVEHSSTTASEIYKIVPVDIADSDCNGNYILDDEELAHGVAHDCDGDGLIDACGMVARVTPSDGTSDEEFGTAVAITDEIAVTGAPSDGDLGASSGSAYVFRVAGDTWTEEQKLLASDGAGGAEFGASVSASGNVVAVGAPKAGEGGIDTGAVYLFRYDTLTGEWSEEERIVASDGTDNAEFGCTVAIDGDVVAVGARLDDEGGSNGGAAYIFRFDGDHWNEEAKLMPADLAGFDEFGYSIDLDGEAVVVGSRHDDDGASNAGSAYVFRFMGGSWQEEDKITPGSPAIGMEFGAAVSISGDRLIVGSPLGDVGGANAGGLFAYERDSISGLWGSEQFFQAAENTSGDQLGFSVALSQGAMVAGANLANAHGTAAGAVYAYYLDEATGLWTESGLSISIPSGAGNELGHSVASSPDWFIAGAPFGATAETDSGAAYLVLTQDCNRNGVLDACDLASGFSSDCNANDTPDECELQFASQPESQVVALDAEVTFTAEIDASPEATYQWRKDGGEIDGATAISFIIASVTADDGGTYDLVVTDGCLSNTSEGATLTIQSELKFRRGDVNGNGDTSALGDSIFLLTWGFLSGQDPPCMDAADVNDDGTVSALQDTIRLLNWGFLGGVIPPAPGPTSCGVDPTDDGLDCKATAASCR